MQRLQNFSVLQMQLKKDQEQAQKLKERKGSMTTYFLYLKILFIFLIFFKKGHLHDKGEEN